MGTLVVSDMISSMRGILLDPTPGVTWLDADFLAYFNEAERAIVNVKHEAVPVRGAIPMAAGSEQVLPAGGLCIMDLYTNAVSGRRCWLVNRELMDAASSNFPTGAADVDVQEWMKDDRDPTRFTVVPPNTGSGSVVALYGSVPTPIANVAATINVGDIYESIIKAFVLSECYQKSSLRQDLAKAAAYKQQWRSDLGISNQSQLAVSPKVGAEGGSK